jgi:hypothetical protein
MSKTDELIKKISDFNVELLGIINYLDENSIIYGVGQLEALQEDMQKLLESEISSLKEKIKKEETLPSDKNIKKHLLEIYKPIFHEGIDLNRHFRNCAFKEIKWFKSQIKQSNK